MGCTEYPPPRKYAKGGAAILAALALSGCSDPTERQALEEADRRCGGRAQSVEIIVVHHGDSEVVRRYTANCDIFGRKVKWDVYSAVRSPFFF